MSDASANLAGKRVLVTGGSMGIGREVSRELARRGALVIVAARGLEAIDMTLGELDGEGHEGVRLDVSDDGAWSAALDRIDAGGSLDGIVTAAGVLGPIGPLDDLAPGDLIATIAINLIGTLLALHHTLPRLRSTNGRAVTLSGGGATSPLPRYDAYAASKAAVVRLTENVAAAEKIELNCVAPGFIVTRMHEQTLRAGPGAAGSDYYERTRAALAQGGFPAAEAAELICFLLSAQARGISGRLLSAQWDPWREHAFRAQLRSDRSLATLRRIDEQFFTHASR